MGCMTSAHISTNEHQKSVNIGDVKVDNKDNLSEIKKDGKIGNKGDEQIKIQDKLSDSKNNEKIENKDKLLQNKDDSKIENKDKSSTNKDDGQIENKDKLSININNEQINKQAIVKYGESISISKNKLLCEIAESSVCKIIIDNKFGNGFFCKFKYYNNNMIYLITCYHVLTEEIFDCYDEIELLFNNNKNIK